MTSNRPHRDFSRKNFGEMQNFLVLGVAILFLGSIIVGILNNLMVNAQIERLGESEYPLPDDYIAQIHIMESKKLDSSIEPGEYVYQMQFGDSPVISGRVRLSEDQTITRSLTIDGQSRMYASADYRLVGSVIKYDNIQGDRYLLHSAGSPVFEKEGKATLELDGHLGIELVNEGVYPSYTGVAVIPDNRAFFNKVIDLHPLNILQKLLIACAIGLMGYILYRINFKPEVVRKTGPDDIFRA